MCSTIGLERITGLALMQIKYRMEPNLDEMIIFFWTTSVMLIAKPLIKGGGGGELYLKPLKFEHIFVAIIPLLPFLLCRYF